MICLVALAVFLVLAVFSARYRPLAREAFDCVFRKMTLRPCESGLDERLKSTLVASVFSKSPRAAGALNRNFELFSWILTALMIASFAYSAFSAYNWVVYGDCNGPGSDGFCPFNDVVTEAAKCGIATVVQPGGSVNDKASIDAANEHGLAMVFTGRRAFWH